MVTMSIISALLIHITLYNADDTLRAWTSCSKEITEIFSLFFLTLNEFTLGTCWFSFLPSHITQDFLPWKWCHPQQAGFPTSVNKQDNPHRHGSRPMGPGQCDLECLSTEALFLGESTL